MKCIFFLTILFAPIFCDAQLVDFEYDKARALYQAKAFLMKELGLSQEIVKFDMDPLAGTSSHDLTSLAFNCAEKGKSGLILGFSGVVVNQYGIRVREYAFKLIELEKASKMFLRLNMIVDGYMDYLKEDLNSNNIYFTLDDLTFLMTKSAEQLEIRVFWNGFDASWDRVSFDRTQKRLMKKLR